MYKILHAVLVDIEIVWIVIITLKFLELIDWSWWKVMIPFPIIMIVWAIFMEILVQKHIILKEK